MLPDPASDLPAVTRFDAFLDALATNQPTDSCTSALDPDLVATTSRLHTAAIAPSPETTFALELRQTLLGQREAVTPQRQHDSVLSVMASHSVPAWKRSRWWPRLEFATMLSVFAVLLLIIAGDGNPTGWWTANSPENDYRGFIGLGTPPSNQSTSDQLSAFAPSNCPTEPITADEAKDLAGTPAQALLPTPTARPATGDLGILADAETTAAVKQAIETWLACLNAGDVWRALPLYSQSYIRNSFLPNQPDLFWEPAPPSESATPTPLPPEQWKVLLAVIRVSQVSDTLVAADVILRFPRAFGGDVHPLSFQTRLYLVRSNAVWLIDEMTLPGNSLRMAISPTVGEQLVVTGSVSVHEQPTEGSTVLAELDIGTTLIVTNPPIDVDGEQWIQVRVPDSTAIGWISHHWVPATSLATATVSSPSFVVGDLVQTKQPATIYPEPSEGSMSVLTVPQLTVLTLTGQSVVTGNDRWWPVRVDSDGISGYILESVLQTLDLNTSTATPTTSAMPTIPPTEPTNDAFVFLIDKAGSTSDDPSDGPSNLDLEKETVRRAIDALPDGASVGVIAFGEGPEWVVPLTELTGASRQQINEGVSGMRPEDDSYLTRAFWGFSKEKPLDALGDITQIVLLSGGNFRDHDLFAYRDVIRGFVRSGVTFSTIAYGEDADTATMQTLAEYGNGFYILVETEADVPTLTIEDGVFVAR